MIRNLFKSLSDFVSQGHLSKTFKTFSLIRFHSSPTVINLYYFNYLLYSCIDHKALHQGRQVHAQIISSGLEQHSVLVPKLLSLYLTFNLVYEVQTIAKSSNLSYPLHWNRLISFYVKVQLFDEALIAYKHMLSSGIRPDNFTYPSVLKACGERLDISFGRFVHDSIDVRESNIYVDNALVSMYGKFGEVEIARQLFDNMLEKDSISWNTMISCYASKGRWGEAFEIFEKMRISGVEVNHITWNTIAGGYLRTCDFTKALNLLSHMTKCGMRLDSVGIVIGLSASSHIKSLKLGKEIHGHAIRHYYDGLENVRNSLITMYSRCRYLGHAYMVFQPIEAKTVSTWNSMLSGYAHLDRSEEASSLFREMLLSRIDPNHVTLASVLPLCARVANLQHGKEFHCYIMRRNIFTNHLLLWNSLVDMYARSGEVIAAKKVFDSLSTRDEVTYTSLIAGYGVQGNGAIALNLFKEMIQFRIKPDHVTMVAVLSACSHSGLVKEGQVLFEEMHTCYGIIPRLEHFACMVDLYGRAGLFKKAREILESMPCRPSPAMWATLLGACRIHGNTDVGEWAAGKLLEMKPENSGYYVLIANMYAVVHSWSKLAKVRTFMRDLGVRKPPGCAWVDIGHGFSPFLVSDTSNPLAQQVYPLLDGLHELMKDAHYVVVGKFVSEDELFQETEL